MVLPVFIFDTSPLITLAGVYVDGVVVIEYILSVVRLLVVETVAQEATVNPHYPDAVIIQDLLTSSRIERLPIPSTPVDYLLDAYPRLGVGKGKGERDTIRLGLVTPEARIVIDDQQAFFVAARFELRPMTLLDLLVDLVRGKHLNKSLALKIVQGAAGRYAPVSIQHTEYKLGEIQQ